MSKPTFDFTAEDLRKDMENMTISEICKFRHIRIFNFFNFFEEPERTELEKIYKEESSLKSFSPYLLKDAEIIEEREKEENYNPLPFDLVAGDKIIAFDVILDCVSEFTVLSIQDKTFLAVDSMGLKRSFPKSDYQFNQIIKSNSLNDLSNLKNDFMFCGNCGKLVKKTGKNQRYCEPCKPLFKGGKYKRELYKQKRIKKDMPESTLDIAIKDCIERKLTYAERQKQNTLKKEGHRIK